ncbi:caspase-1-like [Branchiostoma floridae x Branchiostoma belcheri]
MSCIRVTVASDINVANKRFTLQRLTQHFVNSDYAGDKISDACWLDDRTAVLRFKDQKLADDILASKRNTVIKYSMFPHGKHVEIPVKVDPWTTEMEEQRKKDQHIAAETRRLVDENQRLISELEHLKKQKYSNSYDMNHGPHGIVVIINNIEFEELETRKGADKDTQRLQKVFECLNFTVKVFTNLDNAGMIKVMKDHGKMNFSQYDCFVCCIMSHGALGKVFSSDNVGIDICELIKPMETKRCPSLVGKPRLFFIHACQGDRTQDKITQSDFAYDVKALPSMPSIAHEADVFLGLSTVPGFVSPRGNDGAPYIRFLTEALDTMSPVHDLLTIMTKVCKQMSEIKDGGLGYVSSNHSTLRKRLYFVRDSTE